MQEVMTEEGGGDDRRSWSEFTARAGPQVAGARGL